MTDQDGARKSHYSKLSLLLLLLSFLLLAPRKAHASVVEIIQFLQSITNTLQNDIGQALAQLQRIETDIANTRQQVVWPTTAINQAKSLASRMGTQYVPVLQTIRQLPVASATLQAPASLETAIRSHDVLNIRQADQYYTNVYSRSPAGNDAAPFERNVTDMDDALALASLKQTITSDQNAEQIQNLAISLEQRTAGAAPGSANYLSVEANLASLHSQAQILKVLAAQLRVEAGTLAHENALLKRRALNAHELRNDLQNIFSRSR